MKISKRERQLLTLLVVLLIVLIAMQVFAQIYEAFIRVADVVIIFVVAWALAYLLWPLVRAMDNRTRLNRMGAVLVVYFAIFIALGGILVVLVPGLISQLDALSERGPELAENARVTASGLQAALDQVGVPIDVSQVIGALPQRMGDLAGNIAADALGFVTATAGLVFNITLVLIISFIMLIDGDSLWNRFTKALSKELRSEAELLRQSADRSFGGFIRGSLILGLFYGVATLLYLVPLGVPFAGVLALVAGLAVIIPFFGPIIALVPIVAITLLGAPDRFLWVLGFTLVLQQITLNVLGPRILSAAVGIHPIFVFLALLLGSRIAGFWGVLIAMPIAGILATFVRYAYEIGIGRRRRANASTLIEDRDHAAEEAAVVAKREADEAHAAAAEAERLAKEAKDARSSAASG